MADKALIMDWFRHADVKSALRHAQEIKELVKKLLPVDDSTESIARQDG